MKEYIVYDYETAHPEGPGVPIGLLNSPKVLRNNRKARAVWDWARKYDVKVQHGHYLIIKPAASCSASDWQKASKGEHGT